MKKFVFAAAAACFLFSGMAGAQDLAQNDVPEKIVNLFQKDFPEARDIEWEMDGIDYKVEFEVDISTDHEIWYDSTAEMIRHEEEIAARDLPAAVTAAIKSAFTDYRADDIEKVTTPDGITYTMELEMQGGPDWKVAFDEQGTIVQKRAD